MVGKIKRLIFGIQLVSTIFLIIRDEYIKAESIAKTAILKIKAVYNDAITTSDNMPKSFLYNILDSTNAARITDSFFINGLNLYGDYSGSNLFTFIFSVITSFLGVCNFKWGNDE